MRRILFICWANCVRSQMAEALLNYRGAGRYEALSGGIAPVGSVHAMAIEVLSEAGVPARKLRSKSWEEARDKPLDAVVTLCPFAREELEKEWPSSADGALPIRAHWPFGDPSAIEVPGRVMTQEERLEAFRETRDALRECMEDLAMASRNEFNDDAAFADLLHRIGDDLEWDEEVD